jgi:hypothetical protein
MFAFFLTAHVGQAVMGWYYTLFPVNSKESASGISRARAVDSKYQPAYTWGVVF